MLATVAQVNTRLSQQATTDSSLLTAILEGVSEAIARWCGRWDEAASLNLLEQQSDFTEYVSPEGAILALRLYPVTVVTSVTYAADRDFAGSTTIWYPQGADADEVELFEARGRLLYLNGNWPGQGRGRCYKVVYTGGYATTPVSLREACIRQAISVYQNRRDYGLRSVQHADGTVERFDVNDLLPEVRSMLAGFRDTRMVVF